MSSSSAELTQGLEHKPKVIYLFLFIYLSIYLKCRKHPRQDIKGTMAIKSINPTVERAGFKTKC